MDCVLFDDTLSSATICQIECFVSSRDLFLGTEGLSKTSLKLVFVQEVIVTGLKYRTVTA
jgi:hypothetical protein